MVRAKFEVIENKQDSEDGASISLQAVYDADPESENGKFFKYTPFGEINLEIVNPSAAKAFEVGKEYYVDFSLVES